MKPVAYLANTVLDEIRLVLMIFQIVHIDADRLLANELCTRRRNPHNAGCTFCLGCRDENRCQKLRERERPDGFNSEMVLITLGSLIRLKERAAMYTFAFLE